jgi:hypothetical protein
VQGPRWSWRSLEFCGCRMFSNAARECWGGAPARASWTVGRRARPMRSQETLALGAACLTQPSLTDDCPSRHHRLAHGLAHARHTHSQRAISPQSVHSSLRAPGTIYSETHRRLGLAKCRPGEYMCVPELARPWGCSVAEFTRVASPALDSATAVTPATPATPATAPLFAHASLVAPSRGLHPSTAAVRTVA